MRQGIKKIRLTAGGAACSEGFSFVSDGDLQVEGLDANHEHQRFSARRAS